MYDFIQHGADCFCTWVKLSVFHRKMFEGWNRPVYMQLSHLCVCSDLICMFQKYLLFMREFLAFECIKVKLLFV